MPIKKEQFNGKINKKCFVKITFLSSYKVTAPSHFSAVSRDLYHSALQTNTVVENLGFISLTLRALSVTIHGNKQI